MNWRIVNKESGVDLGVYPGADVVEALEALARDAGYASYLEACRVAGYANLLITEVSPDRAAEA